MMQKALQIARESGVTGLLSQTANRVVSVDKLTCAGNLDIRRTRAIRGDRRDTPLHGLRGDWKRFDP
jgi:hypothetical protein